MSFDTYYWAAADFPEADLSQAKAELAEPSSEAAAARAFERLLRDDSSAANGVALDHYAYAEATRRFGVDNPFRVYAEEVRARARQILAEPPTEPGTTGAAVRGANHASAAAALLNLAEPADQPLLAAAIESASNSEVRSALFGAAGAAADSDTPGDDRLTRALRRVVTHLNLPIVDRDAALRVLNEVAPDDAVALADRILDHAPLELQTRAAWVLAERALEANRQRLAELVERWPDDAPYPAFEVRQALDE